MKTNNNPQNNIDVLSLDDIIFAGRNHAYGAFYLRKNYNKFLIRSFLVTFSLVATLFIVSKLNRTEVVHLIDPGPIISEPIPYNPQSDPFVPPPSGPSVPSQSLIRQLIFQHPVVVDDVTPGSLAFLLPNDDPDFGKSYGDPAKGSGIPGLLGGDGGGTVDPIPDDTIFLAVEESAIFPNGDFRQWVADQVKYPDDIVQMGIEGRVFFEFVINKQGYIEDVNIIRGVDPALDQEVVRVITGSPKWIPGKQGGHPVKQRFTMQINFKLDR